MASRVLALAARRCRDVGGVPWETPAALRLRNSSAHRPPFAPGLLPTARASSKCAFPAGRFRQLHGLPRLLATAAGRSQIHALAAQSPARSNFPQPWWIARPPPRPPGWVRPPNGPEEKIYFHTPTASLLDWRSWPRRSTAVEKNSGLARLFTNAVYYRNAGGETTSGIAAHRRARLDHLNAGQPAPCEENRWPRTPPGTAVGSRRFPHDWALLIDRPATCTAATGTSIQGRAFGAHKNSESILQQYYKRLPIRKKYLRALRRGTLTYDHGQVKIPPVAMYGYDAKGEGPNVYKGKLERLRTKRLWFHD
eukprot:GHVT01063977.1.p1 GENE.GHVT01063977.1~~GHVT01063977.1.p1  ORF type:complete len:309 (+),score=50.31 GHVT01063977.1:248-1174(+)